MTSDLNGTSSRIVIELRFQIMHRESDIAEFDYACVYVLLNGGT
jgi:hypothetical protein